MLAVIVVTIGTLVHRLSQRKVTKLAVTIVIIDVLSTDPRQNF